MAKRLLESLQVDGNHAHEIMKLLLPPMAPPMAPPVAPSKALGP